MYRVLVATVAVEVYTSAGELAQYVLGGYSTESLELDAHDVLEYVRAHLGATWLQASPEALRRAFARRASDEIWTQLELF